MICLTSDDVLLFQGDSITHGGRVESDWDFNHVIGHGIMAQLWLETVEKELKR